MTQWFNVDGHIRRVVQVKDRYLITRPGGFWWTTAIPMLQGWIRQYGWQLTEVPDRPQDFEPDRYEP